MSGLRPHRRSQLVHQVRVLVERLGLSLIHTLPPPKNIFFALRASFFPILFRTRTPIAAAQPAAPLRPPPPTHPICQTPRVCPPRFPTPSSAAQTQTVRLRSLIRPLASPRPPPPSRPTTLPRVRPASTLVDHHSTNTAQHFPLATTPITLTYLNPPRALCVESRLDPPAHTLRHSRRLPHQLPPRRLLSRPLPGPTPPPAILPLPRIHQHHLKLHITTLRPTHSHRLPRRLIPLLRQPSLPRPRRTRPLAIHLPHLPPTHHKLLLTIRSSTNPLLRPYHISPPTHTLPHLHPTYLPHHQPHPVCNRS